MYLWPHDCHHYGIPEMYRSPYLPTRRTETYRALCELVSRSPMNLDQLWSGELRYLLNSIQKLENRNFYEAVKQAKQGVLDDGEKTNPET